MKSSSNTILNSLEKAFLELSASKHHAFFLETRNREEVFNFFRQKIENKNKTENLFLQLQVLDIEKVREIIKYGKINFEKQHFVLLSFYSINREAQNALLKFLEEANQHIKIILIAHTGIKLLPTVFSRIYKLSLTTKNLTLENNKAEPLYLSAIKFLATPKIRRMDLKEINEVLLKKDQYRSVNENKDRVDKEFLEDFLFNLESILLEKYTSHMIGQKDINKEENQAQRHYLEDILDATKFSKNNFSSGKTILEYLSLKLPEIK